MIRVTVPQPAGDGKTFDHAYHPSKHRALIESVLSQHGLVRLEMDRCLVDGAGGPPPSMAAAHLIMQTMAGFQACRAAGGAALMGDTPDTRASRRRCWSARCSRRRARLPPGRWPHPPATRRRRTARAAPSGRARPGHPD